MRRVLLFAGVTAIGLPAIPVIHYRTLSPCEMLQLELVNRVRQDVAEARADAQGAVREHGATAESVAVAVGNVVSAVSVGVAAGAAELRIQRMSPGECASELWRIKVLGKAPRH